ncbi:MULTISPECIES: TonB-dependent receptor [unclassified Sphingomonas]|nr:MULTISPECIES: TonB-dependent receptor [unclassified Sphingomonas]
MRQLDRATCCTLTLAAILTATAAHGQTVPSTTTTAPDVAPPGTTGKDPATAAGQIGDIIVTAQRRAESTQKASVTIQVIGGDELVKSGLTAPADISKLTTGVEIGKGGANTQIFVRGVGSYAYSPLASPGVAFNVDGVYVGRPTGVDGNFYDVARVEVLKGPQGTLYGRNANGGSINVVTNEPKLGRREMALNVEAGNYALINTSGAINLPVGDTIAVRAAFNVTSRDGYLSDDTFDDVKQAGRMRIKWEPSADFSLLVNADYIHVGGRGSNGVYLPRRPGASPYKAVSEPAANDYKQSFPSAAPFAPFTNRLKNEAYQNSDLYNASALLTWNLGFATLNVLPAYRKGDINYVTNDLGGRFQVTQTSDQTSVEARLGNTTSAFTWVVGGFFFDEDQTGVSLVNNGDTPVPFLGNRVLQNYYISYQPKTKSYAGFGQTTITIVDGLRLLAGLRYTHEQARVAGYVDTLETNPPTRLINFPGSRSFDGVTYKVGVEYDLAPRSMFYATYSTGFKAGGFGQSSAPGNYYQPEKLYAAEAGIKNRFFDNRLELNLSGYYWKYKDLQDSRVNFDSAGNLAFITFNAGDATIYGATVDLVVQPTANDRLSFTGEYAHSRYDRFIIDTPAPIYQPGSTGCPTSVVAGNIRQDCTGYQVARLPEWSGTMSYQHTFDLAGGGNVVAGASAKYASARWIGIDFIPAERDGAYAVLDADLTYTTPDGTMSVGLWGRNLTKTVYYTGGIQQAFIAGLFTANIGAPRTYGARATFKF